jgi:hypothetical protein
MSVTRTLRSRTGFDHNPMRRPSDRIEAWAGLGLLVTFLLLGPAITWFAGWQTFRSGVRIELRERSTSYPTQARVVSRAITQKHSSGSTMLSPFVTANWTAPDGTPRTGLIQVASGARDQLVQHIWTDTRGTVVSRPQQRGETVTLTAGVAATTAICCCGALVVARTVIRHRLDRGRYAQWEQEWERIGPDWSRQR